MTDTVNRVTFTTHLVVTSIDTNNERDLYRRVNRYINGCYNLLEAVALTLYPTEVRELNSISVSIDDWGFRSRRTSGTYFTKKQMPVVHRLKRGRNVTNIAVKGTFLTEETPSQALLAVMADLDKANALVRGCFFNLSFFANPVASATHFGMNESSPEEAASLFPQVEVTRTFFHPGSEPRRENVLRSIHRHPTLREERKTA